jgi:hypothetical protein
MSRMTEPKTWPIHDHETGLDHDSPAYDAELLEAKRREWAAQSTRQPAPYHPSGISGYGGNGASNYANDDCMELLAGLVAD